MNITPEHLKGKPKRIGHVKGVPVFHLLTKGGWNIIIKADNGQTTPIGAGPQRAFAYHIAQIKEPDLVIDELSKSDFDASLFQHLVPYWIEQVDRLQSKWGK